MAQFQIGNNGSGLKVPLMMGALMKPQPQIDSLLRPLSGAPKQPVRNPDLDLLLKSNFPLSKLQESGYNMSNFYYKNSKIKAKIERTDAKSRNLRQN